ncbi:phosphomannomutase [Candidatus Scalindua japonica]|uniref:Phosphomannomutase n=2 Tax=Candidatus Scalindua japonica TaxID=1284222 RepID=A0A286U3D4_9BACT|nr:phosphomannomutase [Candidatus Scalindua japonica]
MRIADIHLDIFNGLQLKQINGTWLSGQVHFALECSTITIDYGLSGLLKRRIRRIDISDAQINLHVQSNKTAGQTSDDKETAPMNIKEFYPGHLSVDAVSINNTDVQIVLDDNKLALTKMSMNGKDIQFANPFDISIKGDFSISHLTKNTTSNLPGTVEINTKYSILNDELIILDNSFFLINDLEKFFVNGKARSLLSTPEIKCNISSHGLSINTIYDLLNDIKLIELPPLTIEGECDIDISVQGNFEKTEISLNSPINNLDLKSGDMAFRADVLEIPVEAMLSFSDHQRVIKVDSKFTVHNGFFQIPKVQVTDIDIPIVFAIDYPDQITLASNEIHGKLHYDDTLYSINKLISNFKTVIDLKRPESTMFETQIDTMFSDPARITGNIDIKEKVIRETSFKLHNMNSRTLSETFTHFIPEGYKEWSLNGDISIDSIIDVIGGDRSQKTRAVTDLSFSKLKFSSPDYDYFGEKIDGTIKIDTAMDANFSKFSLQTSGTFSPFLIQLGEFTTDMRGMKTRFSISCNYDTSEKSLTGVKSELSWNNLGTVTAEGKILHLNSNPHIDIQLAVKKFSNTALFETFVKDTVEYSNPVLFNTSVEGESSTHFQINGPKNDLTINGHLDVNDLGITYGELSIEDVNIDLPITMAYPRSKTPMRKQDVPLTQYGVVQLNKLSYGPLEIKDVRINPIINSNNFFIKNPFKIPVFDGTIEIRNIAVENMINSDRKFKLGFQLNNISLKDLSTTYKLTPLEETLNSSAISFQQQGQKLSSKEEINIKLFGGDITIRDLTLNNFMTSMMEIGLSAEVKHLDLGQMSNTYREWGNITGIINGQIKDFKLVAGEPSGFEIQMRTEKTSGIKQSVSTKFLKNFVPGIGKALDKVGFTNYKYAVMGLHARLENDYIKLRGAVKKDGKELFMKGAGMKRLEIVFPNAEKRVPFKTFLSSFKGILDSDVDGTQVQIK